MLIYPAGSRLGYGDYLGLLELTHGTNQPVRKLREARGLTAGEPHHLFVGELARLVARATGDLDSELSKTIVQLSDVVQYPHVRTVGLLAIAVHAGAWLSHRCIEGICSDTAAIDCPIGALKGPIASQRWARAPTLRLNGRNA
jgi:hypothetical protein